MKQITGLEIAAILRSMYSSGKKPHQIAFLLLLHYKKDLSVTEFTYFMGDLKNSSGKLLTRSMVYSYLYALEKQHYVQKEKPKKTIVFIAFGAEETGLVGSKYFVENPPFKLQQINFVFNNN